MVAFIAATNGVSQVFLRSLDNAEARPLKETIGGDTPFFSPDGRWLGFFGDGKLKKMPLPSGTPQVLCSAPSAGDAEWGTDGFIRFSNVSDGATGGISRVSADGGQPEVLTRPNRALGETHHFAPQLVPSTGALLYSVRRQAERVSFQLVVQQPGTETSQVIVDGAVRGRVFPDGTLLYQLNSTLLVTQLDRTMRRTSGSPGVLADGLSAQNPYGAAWAAAKGVIAYASSRSAQRRLVWVSRDGAVEALSAPPREYNFVRLSPDNIRVAVEILDGPDADVWTYDVARNLLTKFTVDGVNRFPVWTPDGKFIALSRRRGNGHDLYWREADASGELRELMHGVPSTWIGSFSSDMRQLVYFQSRSNDDADILMIALNGDRAARPLVQSPAADYGGWLSPDGRWLAYMSDRSGRFELYVKSIDAQGPGVQISSDGAREPRWSPDGRELFYRARDEMLSVPITAGARFSFGKPRVLFTHALFAYGGPAIRNYDVSVDGKRFLMIEEFENGPGMIRVLQGFDHHLPQTP